MDTKTRCSYKYAIYICCLQEMDLKPRDTYRLKVRRWKKVFYTNRYQKKAGVEILISNKIDFKTKTVKTKKDII